MERADVDGPHLALREDLELPADPRRPSFTKGQSSYSSPDQFSLGSSKPKLGFVNKSTEMPVHRHTLAISAPLQNQRHMSQGACQLICHLCLLFTTAQRDAGKH